MIAQSAVRVDVTAADIAAGKRRKSSACPVALAVSRAVGHGVHISMSRVLMPTEDSHEYKQIGRLPDEAANFVYYFDDGQTVWPFSFEIVLTEDKHDLQRI